MQCYSEETVDYSTPDDEIPSDDVAVISLDDLRALLSNLQHRQVIRPEELSGVSRAITVVPTRPAGTE